MSAALTVRVRAGLAVFAAAAWCSGCAGSVHVGASRTLQIALSEYRLNPRSATVSSGFLTLIVRNYGRMTHNLVVSGNGQSEGSTKSIPPGTEATLVVDLSPGQYTMSSTLLSASDLGLRATLRVT